MSDVQHLIDAQETLTDVANKANEYMDDETDDEVLAMLSQTQEANLKLMSYLEGLEGATEADLYEALADE